MTARNLLNSIFIHDRYENRRGEPEEDLEVVTVGFKVFGTPFVTVSLTGTTLKQESPDNKPFIVAHQRRWCDTVHSVFGHRRNREHVTVPSKLFSQEMSETFLDNRDFTAFSVNLRGFCNRIFLDISQHENHAQRRRQLLQAAL